MDSERGAVQSHPIGHRHIVDCGNLAGANSFRHRKSSPGGIFSGSCRRDLGLRGNRTIDQQIPFLGTDIDDHAGIAGIGLIENRLVNLTGIAVLLRLGNFRLANRLLVFREPGLRSFGSGLGSGIAACHYRAGASYQAYGLVKDSSVHFSCFGLFGVVFEKT